MRRLELFRITSILITLLLCLPVWAQDDEDPDDPGSGNPVVEDLPQEAGIAPEPEDADFRPDLIEIRLAFDDRLGKVTTKPFATVQPDNDPQVKRCNLADDGEDPEDVRGDFIFRCAVAMQRTQKVLLVLYHQPDGEDVKLVEKAIKLPSAITATVAIRAPKSITDGTFKVMDPFFFMEPDDGDGGTGPDGRQGSEEMAELFAEKPDDAKSAKPAMEAGNDDEGDPQAKAPEKAGSTVKKATSTSQSSDADSEEGSSWFFWLAAPFAFLLSLYAAMQFLLKGGLTLVAEKLENLRQALNAQGQKGLADKIPTLGSVAPPAAPPAPPAHTQSTQATASTTPAPTPIPVIGQPLAQGNPAPNEAPVPPALATVPGKVTPVENQTAPRAESAPQGSAVAQTTPVAAAHTTVIYSAGDAPNKLAQWLGAMTAAAGETRSILANLLGLRAAQQSALHLPAEALSFDAKASVAKLHREHRLPVSLWGNFALAHNTPTALACESSHLRPVVLSALAQELAGRHLLPTLILGGSDEVSDIQRSIAAHLFHAKPYPLYPWNPAMEEDETPDSLHTAHGPASMDDRLVIAPGKTQSLGAFAPWFQHCQQSHGAAVLIVSGLRKSHLTDELVEPLAAMTEVTRQLQAFAQGGTLYAILLLDDDEKQWLEAGMNASMRTLNIVVQEAGRLKAEHDDGDMVEKSYLGVDRRKGWIWAEKGSISPVHDLAALVSPHKSPVEPQ